MKVRIIINPDNSITIIHPAPKSKREDETEAQWLDRVFNKAMQGELKGLPFKDVDVALLPNDRTERNRWEFDTINNKVIINPSKPLTKPL